MPKNDAVVRVHPDILAQHGGVQPLVTLRKKLTDPTTSKEYLGILEFVDMLAAVEENEKILALVEVGKTSVGELHVTCVGAESLLHAAALVFLEYFKASR